MTTRLGHLAALSEEQRELLARWMPGFSVERDHSWGLVATRVLEVSWRGEQYVLKAAPPGDRHLMRELHAQRHWLGPWCGVAPELVFADGYGCDPREPGAWAREQLREAVGTAVFASQVGEAPFEAQGHRMIAAALDLLERLDRAESPE